MSKYLNNNWKPVKHTIFKNDAFAQQIHEVGYAVIDFADIEQLESLQKLYDAEHNISEENGGMFYSLYSQNLDYRKRINNSISSTLKKSINHHFKDFKEVINTFIVKLSGPQSEFFIHQDTTGLDEHQYSPLSIWLPLHDVNETNGCMSVIPKSHHFFSPFRGISFPYPFDSIKNELAKYLVPVPVKKGQALIFDPRIVHNSSTNSSGKPRVVSLTGLFPKEASFIHCYMDMNETKTQLEFYKQEDDFLIKYPYLLVNCTERPVSGELIDKYPFTVEQITLNDFKELCFKYSVKQYCNAAPQLKEDCMMIAEPNHK